MKTATLISNKHQRFESIYPCKVNLITRQMGTQRIPHGNLSLAHTEVITIASHPRILSSLTCARLRASRFQHAHSPCPQKGGSPSSKAYSASNLAILQAMSVYNVPKTQHVTSTIQ